MRFGERPVDAPSIRCSLSLASFIVPSSASSLLLFAPERTTFFELRLPTAEIGNLIEAANKVSQTASCKSPANVLLRPAAQTQPIHEVGGREGLELHRNRLFNEQFSWKRDFRYRQKYRLNHARTAHRHTGNSRTIGFVSKTVQVGDSRTIAPTSSRPADAGMLCGVKHWARTGTLQGKYSPKEQKPSASCENPPPATSAER